MLGATVLTEPGDPLPQRAAVATATTATDDLSRLLMACGTGDRAAFQALYGRTASKIFGIVCAVLRDRATAEDVLQDVYLQIWRGAHKFDAEAGQPMAWMASIARNRAIDRIRADRVRGFVSYSDEVPEVADPEFGDHLDGMAVRAALAALRPEYRHILLLAYFRGYTQAEAAEIMGIPLGTAKTWLRRGLDSLREAIE